MTGSLLTLVDRFGEETTGLSAVHSGNMGDVIHSLAAVRDLGVQRYVLNLCLDPKLSGRLLSEGSARFLVPLLLAQPSIRCVDIVRAPIAISEGFGTEAETPVIRGLPLEHIDPALLGVDLNFDRFRLQPLERQHLVVSHAKAVGAQTRGIDPWFELPERHKGPKHGIVLSFTPRYRNKDAGFYKTMLEGLGPILKIGLPHEAWVYGDIPGDLITAPDALALAQTLDSAALFIGGQSLPHALAEGLKLPRLVDSPNFMLTSWPLGARGFVLPHDVQAARALALDLMRDPDAASPNAWQAPRAALVAGEDARVAVYGHGAGGSFSEAQAHWQKLDIRAGLVSVQLPLAAISRDGESLRALRFDLKSETPNFIIRSVRLEAADGRALWVLDPVADENARFFGSQSQPGGLTLPPIVSRDGLLLVKSEARCWFSVPVPSAVLETAGSDATLAVDLEAVEETALDPRQFARLAQALDRYAELASAEDLGEKLNDALAQVRGLEVEIARIKRALGPFFGPAQVLVLLLRAFKKLIVDPGALRRAINQRGGGRKLVGKLLRRISGRLTAPVTRRLKPYVAFLRGILGDLRTHGVGGLKGRGWRRRWRDMRGGAIALSPMARETRWWDADYPQWAARLDARLALLPAEAAEPGRIISLVVPVYNPRPAEIEAMVASVRAQKYAGWELCLADDCSPDPSVRPLLERFAAEDPRIKVTFRDTNGHIAEATNSALDIATGDYVGFIDQDDMLHPAALLLCVRSLRANPKLRLIYTDEDKVKDGVRCEPYFKPNWSPSLLHAQYFINHLTVAERGLVEAAGRLRKAFNGAQDVDLFLRCLDRLGPDEIGHVPVILYHWRINEGSIAGDSGAKPYAFEAARNGVRDYFARRQQEVTVGESFHFSLHRVQFPVPATTKLALCLTMGQADVAPEAFAKARRLLADWRERFPEGTARGLLVLAADALETGPEDFGLFAVPAGVSVAEGEALRLLMKAGLRGGADVLVTASLDALPETVDALIELAGRALRDDAGLVGALAVDAQDRVRHAGAIVDPVDGILLPYTGMPRTEHGSFTRLQLAQEMAAVAPWCFAAGRPAAEAVMAESAAGALATVIGAANRLRQAGRLTVWTPYATYRFAQGADDASLFGAGLAETEKEALQTAGALTDPYYHPALSRQTLFGLKPDFPDLAILRT